MRRALLLLLLAAAIPAAPACAQEAVGWYVAGSAGAYLREDSTRTSAIFRNADPSASTAVAQHREFDAGEAATLALGRRLAPHLRVEVEAGYAGYGSGLLRTSTADLRFPALQDGRYEHDSGARLSRYSGTVNGFYDLAAFGRWTPYVGAGVGGWATHASAGRFLNAGGVPFDTLANTSSQGMALVEGGVSIRLSPHWSVAPAYRYTRTFTGPDEAAHVFKAALRYRF